MGARLSFSVLTMTMKAVAGGVGAEEEQRQFSDN